MNLPRNRNPWLIHPLGLVYVLQFRTEDPLLRMRGHRILREPPRQGLPKPKLQVAFVAEVALHCYSPPRSSMTWCWKEDRYWRSPFSKYSVPEAT